jgi:hypothetical protein
MKWLISYKVISQSLDPLTVEAVNKGTMICSTMHRGFKWKMQRVNFKVDVHRVELNNYDMVLGIQWLAILDNICN